MKGRQLTLSALLVSVVGLLWSNHQLNTYRNELTLDEFVEAGVPPRSVHNPPSHPETPPTSTARGRRRFDNFWENPRSTCLHLDNICSGDDGWFYGPPANASQSLHQPSVMLWVDSDDITYTHGFDIEVEDRIYLNVSSASHHRYDGRTCSYSRTPVHLVAQTAYNDMMGEFYSRTVLSLNRWFRDYPPRSNDDVRIYVHFVDKAKQRLFEGHRLFLGGLPNDDEFGNFVSLMPKPGSCECYSKLVFCGYGLQNKTLSALNVTGVDAAIVDSHGNVTVFKPGSHIRHPNTDCAQHSSPKALTNGKCTAFRKLRRDLSSTYVEKDPLLDEKIRRYRKDILIQKGYIDSDANSVDKWTFVGLTHRKYRRIWLNIDEAISMCERKFKRRHVVCITIDVEEADSPEAQLLMHRSLHAIVGVHGAQLTQGVLLPRSGYVLELLPWVPDYLWGGWVATTHVPTPLGLIFHNTDLNHVGYPLGRDSVPLCLHVDASDEEMERRCLMSRRNNPKFRWADRDFNVPSSVIETFIASFLMKGSSAVCDDMQRRAMQHNFVLYNAFCVRDSSQSSKEHVAEHYYRERDTAEQANARPLTR